MFASMAIYMVFQWTFYMKIQWKGDVDVGRLGAFSWAFIMLARSLLVDCSRIRHFVSVSLSFRHARQKARLLNMYVY
jgi:hypothetical protein